MVHLDKNNSTFKIQDSKLWLIRKASCLGWTRIPTDEIQLIAFEDAPKAVPCNEVYRRDNLSKYADNFKTWIER
jgi:hypothetical protein